VKLHFEADLDYQLKAIDAVCDLFAGQQISRSKFTVARTAGDLPQLPGLAASDLGVGNRLSLSPDALLANLRGIQARNAIAESPSLDSRDFTVEMETGTGKTYVYLRTIFELNKRYGFAKFVIVVPSIAIKEGVYKTLQMTEEHFRSLYAGTPVQYFLYDSDKLGQVRTFASSPSIQVMVVTVGAINKKDVNNLYKQREETDDERPVDLIRATHPIVIVDEPQSVDGGLRGAGRKALDSMNPLCTLRYSATHADQHHMVYRLDALEAYERRLVKQIEVASATVEDAHNRPFVQLIAVNSRRGDISARILVDVQRASGVRREEITVHDGEDLEARTGRPMYANVRVGELRARQDGASLELRVPGGTEYLRPGGSWGDVDPLAVQRQMIRRTIREHLDKELRLRPRGIKVLSLFFIDAVDRYRSYDADGNAVKGVYAKIFEEEYARLSAHPDYAELGPEPRRSPGSVHNGYFSIDRKGAWTDTGESTQAERDSAERAYNLIMREKEQLLSFDTPLAFIFSHSALREGWDSPNVFQICALRDIHAERERRQTIGRGLRLCVDQSGARVRGFEANTLTVVATESYEQFAAGLQQEIEAATGVSFGARRVEIMNADERRHVRARKTVLLSDGFTALWDRIKYKTTYRVRFDNTRLVRECVAALSEAPPIPRARLQWRTAGITIGRDGVEAVERDGAATVALSDTDVDLPDILTELQDRTQLTRRTIQRVLLGCGRLADFRQNPQQFIEVAASVINRCKQLAIVDGIKYERLGDEGYYAQELLDREVVGYVRRMIEDSHHKSVYDHIICDSGVEAAFAERMELTSAVKLFAKLPGWFEVQTPLGAYNPDWALLIEDEAGEHLYFVVETKGSSAPEDLRAVENAKIACGRAHFRALRVKEPAAEYVVATTLDEVLAHSPSAIG
jgi:restriction endonuclease